MKRFHIHLVSDATGETVNGLARAAIAQFADVEAVEHFWSLVRNERQVDQVLAGIEANPGAVLYTLVDEALQTRLAEGCRKFQVPAVPLLEPVVAMLSNYLDIEARHQPGGQHALDADYFTRIDAIHFVLNHDDGQMLHDLNSADIVLVGVSRTSKTPTCFYLANRGIKAANVPMVPGAPPPPELEALTNPLVIGLTVNAGRLVEVRRNRLRMLNQGEETDYVDPEHVNDEVLAARRLFSKHDWPVIDVTRRSIEEVAAAILQHLAQRLGGEVVYSTRVGPNGSASRR
jgi:regulator of PEP synthase PpsR (kinase-PPPase family)